ncbi:MAG: ParB/RepB/Spo0J family partition protein [Candidatus Heimdallarchaeaceae archaeon]
MKSEFKTIEVSNILANFSQPREKFDKEKIKELAESILSNGLIQPITVRVDPKRKGKFMIVAGERRWQAHRVGNLKKIDAFVKKYDNDLQWMIESYMENEQRLQLQPIEDGKYLKKIQKEGDLSIVELANLMKKKEEIIKMKFSILPIEKEIKNKKVNMFTTDYKTLSDVASLKNKSDREKVLDNIENVGVAKTRRIISTIKKAPEEVKEALLDDKITVNQAEDLTNIKSDKAREKVLEEVKQHKTLADIKPKLAERETPELTEKARNKFLSVHRIIFESLNESKVALIKANKNISKANQMMEQLMEKSFEYGLPKKTLSLTIQQMKTITDRISEFNIQSERFDELKEILVDRIESKIEE